MPQMVPNFIIILGKVIDKRYTITISAYLKSLYFFLQIFMGVYKNLKGSYNHSNLIKSESSKNTTFCYEMVRKVDNSSDDV